MKAKKHIPLKDDIEKLVCERQALKVARKKVSTEIRKAAVDAGD